MANPTSSHKNPHLTSPHPDIPSPPQPPLHNHPRPHLRPPNLHQPQPPRLKQTPPIRLAPQTSAPSDPSSSSTAPPSAPDPGTRTYGDQESGSRGPWHRRCAAGSFDPRRPGQRSRLSSSNDFFLVKKWVRPHSHRAQSCMILLR